MVASSDADSDGLSIGASALTLNGGTIVDLRDGATAAALGLGANAVADAAGHKVDGSMEKAPAVVGVQIGSTPADGTTYKRSEKIRVAVAFDRVVAVTNSHRLGLALTLGAQTRQASYLRGTGTKTLTFEYAVQPSDADSDGLSIGASALTLNGGGANSGAIRIAGGTANALLGLGTHAISNSASHKVDGSRIVSPSVDEVAIGGRRVGDTYELGQFIIIFLTFDREVVVTGAPQVALRVGTQTRQAEYFTGSADQLTFTYVVQASDVDADGVSMDANALTLNGGTIASAVDSTTAANLATQAFAPGANYKVNGAQTTQPSVTTVAFGDLPTAQTYELGDEVVVSVGFDRVIEVTGAPQLALTIGAETRQASFDELTRLGDILRFSYVVRPPDADSNGISIGANALTLNGGTIRLSGSATVNANLGLGAHAIVDDANHKVDSNRGPPGVSGLALNSPATDDTYGLGDVIEATVTFNKAVDVTGTPQLALGIGEQTRQASYASGTGTASLVFRYTVVAADADSVGLSIGASALTLNGGTIDAAGGTTDALLGLGGHAVSNSASHKVDGALERPKVTDLVVGSPPTGDTFERNDSIAVTVTFNKAGGRDGDAAAGAGDRRGDEAGGLCQRNGDGVAGLPLPWWRRATRTRTG